MKLTRRELLDELEALTERIEDDRVTQDDDRALASTHFLRYYIVDHMTEQDFALGPPS